MPDTDSHLVAWSAGFIDGEGCFTIRANGNVSRIPCLNVGQNHREPLELLQKLYGGIISTCRRERLFYMWELTGAKRIRAEVPHLLPHLVCKKREAELLLDYAARQIHGNRKLSLEEVAIRLDL